MLHQGDLRSLVTVGKYTVHENKLTRKPEAVNELRLELQDLFSYGNDTGSIKGCKTKGR